MFRAAPSSRTAATTAAPATSASSRWTTTAFVRRGRLRVGREKELALTLVPGACVPSIARDQHVRRVGQPPLLPSDDRHRVPPRPLDAGHLAPLRDPCHSCGTPSHARTCAQGHASEIVTACCTCARLQGVAPPTESTVRIIALALAGMFTGVLSIFAGQHTLIVLRNKTQVEDIVSVANQRGRWIFDIGRAANWRQVMGPHWWQWVLPVAFRSVTCKVPRRGHRQPLTLCSGGKPGIPGLQRNGRDQLPQQRRACARGRLGRVEPAPAPCQRRCRQQERRRRSQDCVNN